MKKELFIHSPGFTLIEIAVVLLISSILISMSVRSYRQVFGQQELVEKTQYLYNFLRFANSLSKKINKKVYVHFCDSNNDKSWMMFITKNDSCDCLTKNTCQLDEDDKLEELVNGTNLFILNEDMKFQGNKISYSPMRFNTQQGSVTLTNTNDVKLKVIQSRMRLRICSVAQSRLGYPKC